MHSTQIVDIFYPVYKNTTIFEFVLKSCLEQDHENIRIHIYDNAFAEGYFSTSKLVKKINDKRIIYHKNLVNVGHIANYAQIIAEMKKTRLSICLPFDIGFTKTGLSKMIQALIRTGASVVFPSAYSASYKDILSIEADHLQTNYINILRTFQEESEIVLSGYEIVKEYFSEKNINGEYNDFSFFGALIVSSVIHAIESNFLNYRYHGFEHYLSMDLAINSSLVTRLSAPCLQAVIGSPRIGGTERPPDYFTRLEPIVACNDFLESKYFLLKKYFDDLGPFFTSQINKCQFFKDNYQGYQEEISRLIKNSKGLA